ncbi:hypothetical protein SCHPADRAFT_593282 [Schizopora paradoxa]|uniref:Uncharacterized protein n=1 Tax=Schizopora paradoxa TaxID=27342 RepID=A0A0H2RVF9_9AGAM|nr:hypothetical protein SCHPADRAFT_593282 [Schizopora paradoxa]
MPRFPLCKLTWRFCLCFRPEDVAQDETGAIRGDSAASIETNSRAIPNGNEIRPPEQEDRTTDDNMKENPNYREEFLQAAKLALTAGKNITSIFSFPGSNLIFDVLTGVIEHVQTTKENEEAKKVLQTWISKLCSLLPSNPSVLPESCLPILDDFKSDIFKQLEACSEWEGKSGAGRLIFAKIDKDKFTKLTECVTRAVQQLQLRLDLENTQSNLRVEQSLSVVHEKIDAEAG